MVAPALFIITTVLAQKNLVVNPGFEQGLSRWTFHGDVRVERHDPIAGKSSLAIGVGSITQTLPMDGLHILYIAAKVRGKSLRGELKVECQNDRGENVMTNVAGLDPKKVDQEPGIYFKTQATTKKIKLSIRGDGPEALVDEVLVRDDTVSESHPPEVNLDAAMERYWYEMVIPHETVLMESIKGAPPAGILLFPPRRVISVQDYSLKTTYIEGKDYRVTLSGIEAVPGGNLPTVKDTDFPQADLQWTDLQGKHVVVTYEKIWDGPYVLHPEPSPHLAGTRALLQSKRPVRIVAFGDSITLGIGTSRYSHRPPYQPTWAELVERQLREDYKNSHVKLFNTALGGMTSDWAKEVAPEAVAALKPDLVIIAFGMNDFWWMPADHFIANVKAVMASVKKRAPKAEFLLIAPMKFDPQYAREAQYPDRLDSYGPALRALESRGVAVLDMTSITKELYGLKKPKDFLSDPLHPNDFLARIHAQWIVQMLSP